MTHSVGSSRDSLSARNKFTLLSSHSFLISFSSFSDPSFVWGFLAVSHDSGMLRQNQWFCQNNSRANGLPHGTTAEPMGLLMEQQQRKWACTWSNSRATAEQMVLHIEQQQSKWASTWSNSRAKGLAHRATAEQIGLHIEQQQSKWACT